MGVSLPKILFRLAKNYLSTSRMKFPHVKEAMICIHSDWADFVKVVSARKDHTSLAEAAFKLATTLIQFIHDLGDGIGRWDADLPADDLIRGTKMAESPCCKLDSKFVGILPTARRVRWRMLCPCGKEWHL